MCFLGHSILHKGFKCVDPRSGRVYISRDVAFDESVFPFSELNPNAGRRLQEEFSLLSHGVSQFNDHVLTVLLILLMILVILVRTVPLSGETQQKTMKK
jgi:hypothetical protein